MPRQKEWVDSEGVRVRIYGSGSPRRIDVTYALGVAWTLFRERDSYDVVYFLMQGLHLATGLPVARFLGKPIVMKFSGSGIIPRMRATRVGRLVLSFLNKWAAKVLVLNPGMAEEAIEAGLDQAKLAWMPNPVDTDYFKPATPEERLRYRNELNVPADAPLVVFVGRLVVEKQIPCLLGAFAKLVRERPAARLALLGDGPLREETRALVRKLSLESNVILTGLVPTSQVLKWNQVADTFVLVSELEGLPCALIEAMAAGVPPVVSSIPANIQLVEDGVHGLRTELGNEESIAHALGRMLADGEARRRMGAAARQRMIEEYSTACVVDRYERLFREIKDK